MTITFFDIETLPTDDQSIIDKLAASIKPPGNYKKKEAIEGWMMSHGADELKEKVARTALNGLYGKVACVAWAGGGGGILATGAEMDEKETIKCFFDYVDFKANSFCGHNLAGFDLPFLKHRAVILGIRPPSHLFKAMNSKPWDDCILDTMLMWSSDRKNMVSMDNLCHAFGIEGKGDFNGSMVAETWLGDPQKVIDYCKDDVSRTRKLYKKLTFA